MYIILGHRPKQHLTFDDASEELNRLRSTHPNTALAIYKVGRIPAGAFVRVGDHDPEVKRS